MLLYALLKLRLLRGKCIIFVRDTDRCYKLRLFLEQFGIRACVLNAQMPVNSRCAIGTFCFGKKFCPLFRCHIVQQFNEDAYNYIIASDACELNDGGDEGEEQTDQTNDAEVEEKEPEPEANVELKEESAPARRRRSAKVDAESGVGRGIDFARVANVINFDMPPNVETYIHRVGRWVIAEMRGSQRRSRNVLCRTARAWSKGTALTFADADSATDARTVNAVRAMLARYLGDADLLKPYNFRMEELDGFRYRARDVLRQVDLACRE